MKPAYWCVARALEACKGTGMLQYTRGTLPLLNTGINEQLSEMCKRCAALGASCTGNRAAAVRTARAVAKRTFPVHMGNLPVK